MKRCCFRWTMDDYDPAAYADLPKGIQGMVAASPEYATATGKGAPQTQAQRAPVKDTKADAAKDDTFDDFEDDDIPF
jgi:hypothetical protein